MKRRSWNELIAEGKRLKVTEERVEAEAGNVRWQWGDLALEVAPMGSRGKENGASETLRRYAEELDVSFESLSAYRSVAHAWPNGMRIPFQPWVVHQQFMGRDDREQLIANPVDVRTEEPTPMKRWTFRAAQRFLGQKPSPHYEAPPRTASEKGEMVAGWLDDPEFVEALELILEGWMAEHGRGSTPREKVPPTFENRCETWVRHTNKLFMDGAQLAAEAEEMHDPSPYVSLALLIYGVLSERHIDAEIRTLLEGAG